VLLAAHIVIADADEMALREELRELEERIPRLRQELVDLRDELRDFDDSPTATRLLEEQEALIEVLEQRRLTLLERLGLL